MTLTQREGSPFDAIRQTRPDGTEFWSARDLMAAMRYDRWENFSSAIERARTSAAVQGHDPDDLLRGVTKKGQGRPQQDFELARFGAYLVVMNGDPRKPEVAAAQGYFAVRTREAEVRRELDEIEVAERYLAALREKKALAAKVEADAPLVAQAQAFRQADGLRTIGDLANDLKVWAASNLPGVKVLHQDIFDIAGRVGLIIRGDTVRNNQPTARAIEAGWVKPKETVYDTTTHGQQAKVSTRLTPRGWARLWDAAISHYTTGLAA